MWFYLFNRLYKNDIEKRKQNLEILNQVCTPSFQPVIFEKNISINKIKRIKIDDKMKNNHRSVDNITSNIILNNKIEKEEEKNIERNDFINLIRNKLFNKFKKEEKYQSAMNFKVIDYENIFE